MDWINKKFGFEQSTTAAVKSPNIATKPQPQSNQHVEKTALLNGNGTLSTEDIEKQKNRLKATKELVNKLSQVISIRNENEKIALIDSILNEFCSNYVNISVLHSKELQCVEEIKKLAVIVWKRFSAAVLHQIDRQSHDELYELLNTTYQTSLNTFKIISNLEMVGSGDFFSQIQFVAILIKILHLFNQYPPKQSHKNSTSDELCETITTILSNIAKRQKNLISIFDLMDIICVRQQNKKNLFQNQDHTWRVIALEVLHIVLNKADLKEADWQIFDNKNYLKLLIDTLADFVDLKETQHSKYYYRAIVDILTVSSQVTGKLSEEFLTHRGYDCITSYLGCCLPSGAAESFNFVINCFEQLLLAGNSVIVPKIPEQPFQLKTANFTNLKSENSIKNPEALVVFIDIFKSNYYKLSKTRGSFDPLYSPDKLKFKLLQSALLSLILKLFLQSIANYFIMESFNILFTLIENFAKFEIDLQQQVLLLCEHVLLSISYVPVKELVFLLPYIQCTNSDTSETSLAVCQMFFNVLKSSSKCYSTVFREVGLLSALTCCTHDLVIPCSNEICANPFVFHNKKLILKTISIMTCEDLENANAFRKISNGVAFDLLKFPEHRNVSFEIIKSMINESLSAGSKELPEFSRLIEVLQSIPRDHIDLKLEVLLYIMDTMNLSLQVRDAFRESGGFVALISILLALENIFCNKENISNKKSSVTEDLHLIRSMMKSIFSILIIAIKDNESNRRFLVEEVGINTIGDALLLTGIMSTNHCDIAFGGLLGLSLEDTFSLNFFKEDHLPKNVSPTKLELIAKTAITSSEQNPTIKTPGFLLCSFNLLPHANSAGLFQNYTLQIFLALSKINKNNQLQMNECGILEILINWIFEKDSWIYKSKDSIFIDYQVQTVKLLSKILIEMGISDSELRVLFKKFQINQSTLGDELHLEVMELILHGLKSNKTPCYLELNSANQSNGCLWFEDFGKPFPPANGYTFLSWVKVEKFDPVHNIPIIRIVDNEEKTRLLFTVENKLSRKLRIQTFKTNVTIDTFQFEENRWYHCAIVHQKPRITASYVDVYINGELIQHVKCPYLGHPGSAGRIRTFFGFSSEQKSTETYSSVLHLGPTYLMEETLLNCKDVNIIYHIGFDYTSNFQGNLSKYLSNEAMQLILCDLPTKKSMREKASQLNLFSSASPLKKVVLSSIILEEKILIALIPKNYLGVISKLYYGEKSSILLNTAKFSAVKAVLNSSPPKINETSQVLNMAYLKGEALVICPQKMVDGIWKIGGMAVILKLIDISDTTEALLMSCKVFAECLRCNWRNVEETENNGFYELLGHLLRKKEKLLSTKIMDVLLEVVGKYHDNADSAVIFNLAAYRYLFMEFELWQSSYELQKYHISQFLVFAVQSVRSELNMKKLHVTIVKRLLSAMKMQLFSDSLMQDAMNLLKILVQGNFTAEMVRHICTFLVATLPKSENGDAFKLNIGRRTLLTSSVITPVSETVNFPKIIFNSKEEEIPNYHVALRNYLLNMILEVLCESKQSNVKTKVFLSAITTKWVLLFFQKNLHPYTVVLATKVLARLMYNQETVYIDRFKEGFVVLSDLLTSHCYNYEIFHSLLSIFCGTDISLVPYNTSGDVATLMALYKLSDSSKKKTLCSEVAFVIVELIKAIVNSLIFVTEKFTQTLGDSEDRDDFNQKKVQKALEFPNAILEFFVEASRMSEEVREAITNSGIYDRLITIFFTTMNSSKVINPEDECKELAELLETDNIPSYKFTQGSFKYSDFKFSSDFTQEKIETWKVVDRDNEYKNSSYNGLRETIGKLLISACIESIFISAKPLRALDLMMKGNPIASIDSQVDLHCYLLLHLMYQIQITIKRQRSLLIDVKSISNLAKVSALLIDRLCQGLFSGGHIVIMDFVLSVLEFTQQEMDKAQKFDQSLTLFYKQSNRLLLLCLGHFSTLQKISNNHTLIDVLQKMVHYQKIIFHIQNNDNEFYKCLIHHIYGFLVNTQHENTRMASLAIWKLLILQRPTNLKTILRSQKGVEFKELIEGFGGILEMEQRSFVKWIESRKEELNSLFYENATKVWDSFSLNEMKTGKEGYKLLLNKRFLKIKKIIKREEAEKTAIKTYFLKTKIWTADIQNMESKRALTQKENEKSMRKFFDDKWKAISNDLISERSLWGPKVELNVKWKLDFTEGRSRMRKKMVRNNTSNTYLSKLDKIHNSIGNLVTDAENSPYSSAIDPLSSSLNVSTGKFRSLSDSSATIKKSRLSNSPALRSRVISDADSIVLKDLPSENGEELSFVEDNISEDQTSTDDEANLEDEDEYEKVEMVEQESKITRLIDPGDSILEGFNLARIVGLDVFEGVLLLCREAIYVIDSYFKRADGEYVDIDNAPINERNEYNAFLSDNRQLLEKKDNDERYVVRKWNYQETSDLHFRLFLLRNVAAEIFLADGRSLFLSFSSTKIRDLVYNKLLSKATLTSSANTEKFSGTSGTEGLGTKLRQNILGVSPLQELTQKWIVRDISNFEYLMRLNSLAGRSYNDLTQYPVFPWIIKDYESEELNLDDSKSFRDLSKPMGAQGEERCEKFIERFQMCEDPDNNAPSHYAVHYSSAMIVCAYLIRLEPFTQQYLQLQGGHFDHPDRLFQSIGSSWKSASEQNMADVRELIPEFFYLPEILTNHNKFNFGTNQKEEKVDDVILPKWAKGDPRLFIEKNREALESEYVNANLNDWIDLIFGYKQQGEEAVKAVNTFHYLSYEGAVDIDSIEDPIQKLATIGIINNFGQTPRQLFKKPHPKRMEIASNNTLLQQQQISQDLQLNIPQNIMNNFVSLSAQYRIHTHAKSLIQSALPIKVVPNQIISDVKLINEKVIVVGSSKTLIPPNFNKFMEIDYLDNSLRLFQTDNGKLLNVFENLMHIGHITCITFSDQDTLITGGSDAVICIWKFENSKVTNLALKSSLRGHLKKILVLAISKSYNFLVSGGEDNVAIIWDLNKKKYIKTLTGHDSPVTVLAINENTGDICTSTSTVLKIWSINGDLLFSKTVSNQISDPVTCCIFYEGRSSEVFSTVCVITGHKKGHIKLWIKMPTSSGIMSTTSQTNISTISNNKSDNALNTYMELKLVKTLEQHTNACAISYLYIPSSQRYLISGDIYGRVYSWGFPDGGNTEIHYCYGENCFSCNSKFTVLERKLNCRCCGGLFCLQCMDNEKVNFSYCIPCAAKIKNNSMIKLD